MGKYGTSDSV